MTPISKFDALSKYIWHDRHITNIKKYWNHSIFGAKINLAPNVQAETPQQICLEIAHRLTYWKDFANKLSGYFCRIWAIKDTAVHKSLVQSASCDDETLKYNIANDIVGKFTGEGEAQALCCNWSYCNLNITLAMLSEEPSRLL